MEDIVNSFNSEEDILDEQLIQNLAFCYRIRRLSNIKNN